MPSYSELQLGNTDGSGFRECFPPCFTVDRGNQERLLMKGRTESGLLQWKNCTKEADHTRLSGFEEGLEPIFRHQTARSVTVGEQ